MWVFTDFGFFSIVRDQQHEGNLLVRARVRDHLVRFAGRLKESTVGSHLGAPDDIRCTPGADYLWKLSVPQVDAAVLLAELVADIDYTNFKGRCAQTGALSGVALHDVWEVMSRLQDVPPYDRGTPPVTALWPKKKGRAKKTGKARGKRARRTS
jgi:hypothetical protein